MSTITTASYGSKREVWIRRERYDIECILIESGLKRIEDVKEVVFGDSRRFYVAFHRGQFLESYQDIPDDAGGREPIHFKKIESGSSTFLVLITFFFLMCRYFQHPSRMKPFRML